MKCAIAPTFYELNTASLRHTPASAHMHVYRAFTCTMCVEHSIREARGQNIYAHSFFSCNLHPTSTYVGIALSTQNRTLIEGSRGALLIGGRSQEPSWRHLPISEVLSFSNFLCLEYHNLYI